MGNLNAHFLSIFSHFVYKVWTLFSLGKKITSVHSCVNTHFKQCENSHNSFPKIGINKLIILKQKVTVTCKDFGFLEMWT